MSDNCEKSETDVETLDDLRIPDEGNINTLIAKLAAKYLSDVDEPEDVDEHKEHHNATIDEVEKLVREHRDRHQRLMESATENGLTQEAILEDGAVQALDGLLGEFTQKGGTE